MANSKSEDKSKAKSSSEEQDGYNTPLDPMQRHTGMYEAGDGKEEAQPEGGSSNTGLEGAPNQGTEKR
ncbi:hypothetical protein IQ273_22375 [Nodosilinea sp. LEGE 07298]|jgi:photosystem I subunit 4|uniref:hypothetical protein n=1 Tax=Nodosilinea sp. LEGE 07298 TaxID=2777970 RepID=UPI00187EA2A4|nr:hypothetical protein [Nodosilinea sp. LEGE 07298]MBE9112154.1 hypothetical protein [Nodosilinea sp. LEGE 07298]